MRIFVNGMSGLLGLNFAVQARARVTIGGSYQRHAVAIPGVTAVRSDSCSAEAMRDTLRAFAPDVVLHTVGLTSVDACEQDPVLARRLNVDAARIAAEAAAAARAHFIHISTDQLFDGHRPLAGEDEPPAPLNVYGATKRDAEEAVRRAAPDAAIVRTNFFGWGTSVRTSFSDWIVAALERHEPLYMFSDAYFSPILVNDLTDALLGLAERRYAGTLNVAGAERLTKLEFARRLAGVFGLAADTIVPRPLAEFGLRARRPLDMSLDTSRASRVLGRRLPSVTDSLQGLLRLRQEGWPEQLESALRNPSPA